MNKLQNLNDGRDALDMMFEKMYPNSSLKILSPCRCTRPEQNINDSVLDSIIQKKIENKALPLALRKRMLYEQARAS